MFRPITAATDMIDLMTAIVVFGSLIVVGLVLVIIAFWRRGTQYERMTATYREMMARHERAERHRPFTEWDILEDLDEVEESNQEPSR